jgi:hypothetical protein
MTAPTPLSAATITEIVTPALNAVLQERVRGIDAFGHTAASDDALGLDALGRKAHAFALIAAERAAGPPQRRDLPRARKKAAQAGALILALIDAIDRETAREATTLHQTEN